MMEQRGKRERAQLLFPRRSLLGSALCQWDKNEKDGVLLPNLHFPSRHTCSVKPWELCWRDHQRMATLVLFSQAHPALQWHSVSNLRCHLRDHPNVLWPGLSPQSEVWARCCPKAVGIGEPSETHSDVSGDSDVPLDANFSECVQQPGFLTQSGHGLPEFSVAGTERAEHSQP